MSCGTLQSVGGPRKLFLGSDAPPSVLAGTLFDNLPAGPSGDQRKFLVFSDSRQDAAFFAPYLERTYGSISRRRLILAGLRALWAEYDDEALRPEDVAPAIRRLARDRGFFPDSYGAPQQMSEVKAWLMAELTAFDHRQSLGGVGLATRRWARPRQWVAPGPLLSPPWNLTADEAWTLIEMLGLSLLDRQAIVFPDGVSPSQDVFEPRNKEYYVRRDGASASEGIISWCQSPQ